jgi:hypothetical protein
LLLPLFTFYCFGVLFLGLLFAGETVALPVAVLGTVFCVPEFSPAGVPVSITDGTKAGSVCVDTPLVSET